MDLVYLDHNAATPLLPESWEAMRPFFVNQAGNPASSHYAGRKARQALEDARERIAHLLDAHPDEILFTSGATEANNLAIFGLAGAPPAHLLFSLIEHPSVIGPLEQLAARGFNTDVVCVNSKGVVEVSSLAESVQPETRVVCVMLANHETGAVQPVAELTDKVGGRAFFHCDAAAAAGKVPMSFARLGVTTLTVSAHKFRGPVGIGALVVRRGTGLRPLLWGGHQQQGRRPGTEPVPLAVGMAVALEYSYREMDARLQKMRSLRQSFMRILKMQAQPLFVNGLEDEGVPHTLNVSFPGCRADLLLMNLDLAGVACATGSACSSGSLLPSPVIRAMNVPTDVLESAMRFSFSDEQKPEEIEEGARRVAAVVQRLRAAARR
jgi:cysteine desulfurase